MTATRHTLGRALALSLAVQSLAVFCGTGAWAQTPSTPPVAAATDSAATAGAATSGDATGGAATAGATASAPNDGAATASPAGSSPAGTADAPQAPSPEPAATPGTATPNVAAGVAGAAPPFGLPVAPPPGLAAAAEPAIIHDPASVKPATPLPEGAMLPGAAGVRGIVCDLAPGPDGAPRRVSVIHPWSAAPVLIGPDGPLPARFFKRGRTLIFDARWQMLYVDRDHLHATFARGAGRAVENLRGTCRPTP